MARTLKFSGYSDDTFLIDGVKGKEPRSVDCFGITAVIEIKSSEGVLLVVGLYAPGDIVSCWSVGLSQSDENEPIPQWPMRWGVSGYSVELSIDVPDDAVVSIAESR